MTEILKRIREALQTLDQDVRAVEQTDGNITTLIVFQGKLYKILIKEVI